MKKLILLSLFFGTFALHAADLIVTGNSSFGRLEKTKLKILTFTLSNPNAARANNVRFMMSGSSLKFNVFRSTCNSGIAPNGTCTFAIRCANFNRIWPFTRNLTQAFNFKLTHPFNL